MEGALGQARTEVASVGRSSPYPMREEWGWAKEPAEGWMACSPMVEHRWTLGATVLAWAGQDQQVCPCWTMRRQVSDCSCFSPVVYVFNVPSARSCERRNVRVIHDFVNISRADVLFLQFIEEHLNSRAVTGQ